MRTVTPEQVIARAAQIIADPKHWTTGTEARDVSGNRVSVDDPYAVQFCARGAVMKATIELTGQHAMHGQSICHCLMICAPRIGSDFVVHPLFTAAMRKLDHVDEMGIVGVNDHQGYKAVMRIMAHAQHSGPQSVKFAVLEPMTAEVIEPASVAKEVLVEPPKLVKYIPTTPLELVKVDADDYDRFRINPTKKVDRLKLTNTVA